MHVEILTPEKTLFEGDADIVTLPGSNGSFQIKKDHAPLIANLGEGNVTVGNTGKTESYAVKGGLVEVLKNKVVVLV